MTTFDSFLRVDKVNHRPTCMTTAVVLKTLLLTSSRTADGIHRVRFIRSGANTTQYCSSRDRFSKITSGVSTVEFRSQKGQGKSQITDKGRNGYKCIDGQGGFQSDWTLETCQSLLRRLWVTLQLHASQPMGGVCMEIRCWRVPRWQSVATEGSNVNPGPAWVVTTWNSRLS